MQLYSVAENGALRKIKKIDFNATKVYLIDDIKTFYIWIGNKSSNKKVEYSNKSCLLYTSPSPRDRS